MNINKLYGLEMTEKATKIEQLQSLRTFVVKRFSKDQ